MTAISQCQRNNLSRTSFGVWIRRRWRFSRGTNFSLSLLGLCSFSTGGGGWRVGTSFLLSFSLSLTFTGMSDVDETLFGNNNYRETCDMSKYSGCRGQRFALREYTYTSRVIHTLVCRSVIVDSQSLHCAYMYTAVYTRMRRLPVPSKRGKRSEEEETKGGNAVQLLTELDGFEKS